MFWDVSGGFWNFDGAQYAFIAIVLIIDATMILLSRRTMRRL